MLEILQFTFQSPFHFFGVLILISTPIAIFGEAFRYRK